MTRRFFGTLAIALWLSTSAAWADVTETDTYEQTVSLAAGGQVEIETTNGSIKVASWDRSEVEVVARKKGRGDTTSEALEMLEAIEIRIEERGDALLVSAELPRSGWFGGGSASVSFTLKVPADAKLSATSSNGSIEVRELGGSSRLETDNGSIKADGVEGALYAHSNNGSISAYNVHGAIDAQTNNGTIKAEIATPDLDEDVTLETNNGSVDLRIDPGVAASVYARTRNGSVSTSFPGGSQDRKKKTLDLDINGGGAKIELETTNGSIRVREL